MSKLTKFFKHPVKFFQDATLKKRKTLKSKLNNKITTSSVTTATEKVADIGKTDEINKSKKNLVSDKINKDNLIPDWYHSEVPRDIERLLNFSKPYFLYFPWIENHTNKLIFQIYSTDYNLIPLAITGDISDNLDRRNVVRFARNFPSIYKKILTSSLIKYKKQNLIGFIFTFDWFPVTRIIAEVCKDLNIPTILIPHEGVFANRNMYYKDVHDFTSLPQCDIVLAWGDLHKDIFVERGYPCERIISVGAIKFDEYKNYSHKISHHIFTKMFGLSQERKIILFAAQPLDSQYDKKVAREKQIEIILDILKYCQENQYQFILRMPPSKDKLFPDSLFRRIENSTFASVDDAHFYLVSPEEAISHSDVIVSINSTMLFEATLMGKQSIIMKYLEFDSMWEKLGIPVAHNYDEFVSCVQKADKISTEQLDIAASIYGVGAFDGLAKKRIKNILTEIAKGERTIFGSKTELEKFFDKDKIDVVSIAKNDDFISKEIYLQKLLNTNTLLSSIVSEDKVNLLSSSNLFIGWGKAEKKVNKVQKGYATSFRKDIITIEYGFFRNINRGMPTLSIICDDIAEYYNSQKISRLETLIQNGRDLSIEEKERSKKIINIIVKNKLSQYKMPYIRCDFGNNERKILLIDQPMNDDKVSLASSNAETFEFMLRDAINDNPNADIIIKRHPDGINEGKETYLNDALIDRYKKLNKNIYLIDENINPYSLLEYCNEVYCISSNMGFEALMAGKKVHCYGISFYSNYGLTEDKIKLDRRTRKRSLEEIFYFAYIELSRYYNPDKNSLVEIEEILDYIISHS